MLHEAEIRAAIQTKFEAIASAGRILRSRRGALVDETVPTFMVGDDGQPVGVLISLQTANGAREGGVVTENYRHRVVLFYPAPPDDDSAYDAALAIVSEMAEAVQDDDSLGVLHVISQPLEVVDGDNVIEVPNVWAVYRIECALESTWDVSC